MPQAQTPWQQDQASKLRAMSLYVVDREMEAYHVKMSGPAAKALGEAWARTLDRVSEGPRIRYTPDVIVRGDEREILVLSGDLSKDVESVDLLLSDLDLPKVAPKTLDTDELYLYALVGETAAGRIVMVKKVSPVKHARGGKWWAMAGDELRPLEENPWQIHAEFDLVASEKGACAISQYVLDLLLGDAKRILRRVPKWVDEIADALPMDTDERQRLEARCVDSSRLRRRLRAISARGHISKVKLAAVRAHMRAVGLDPKRFVKGKKLVFGDAEVGELLEVLNEDLFTGGLTGEPFRSDAKVPLQ